MATWAIGDIQGCLKPLENLLSKIKFNPKHDRLWLAGDLIGRGPDSLGVLDLVISLGPSAISVLGNHDLNFLAIDAGVREAKEEDNLDQLLDHPNRQKYINYYNNQSLIIYSPELDAAMAHAGIYPWWSISQCINLSKEITDTLNSDNRRNFLSKLFKQHRSWNEAIARYHSSLPKRKEKYLKKVYSFWNDVRQKKIVIKTNYVDSHEKKQIENFRKILKKENI